MKIALLGSAPSSVHQAPFKDSTYQEWAQGKLESTKRAHGQVPGDWDIWGCSPGAWAVCPRATRWFEVHRWEPGREWFSHEYCDFLIRFKGPVYTGAFIPEIENGVVYPIDRMEEKFSSYFMTSSLALMMALAIDTIEQIRKARESLNKDDLPEGIPEEELTVDDYDDAIGMWGVDMSANEEYAYQRPGCQFFVLEAQRRGIAVYLPPESDLMRPMPVYGISEWDHNYLKLTSRARELNQKAELANKQAAEAQQIARTAAVEMATLNGFVNTWTSPYGMQHGMFIRHTPGTGLGSGITHVDTRPVTKMTVDDRQSAAVKDAAAMGERLKALKIGDETPQETLNRIIEQYEKFISHGEDDFYPGKVTRVRGGGLDTAEIPPE